jgi:hypothetical protein
MYGVLSATIYFGGGGGINLKMKKNIFNSKLEQFILIQWVLGVNSLVVKRPGLEADHSPPLPQMSLWHSA